MAAGWLGIGSAHLDSDCGDDGGSTTIENALDGTDAWVHTANETHWFIIDLGQVLNVQQVRGRSGGDLSRDPILVDIYVSEDKVTWGTAVASNIATWQDTTVWQEVDTTDKNGRYVKVEITATEDALKSLEFGGITGAFFKIFDVYAVGI